MLEFRLITNADDWIPEDGRNATGPVTKFTIWVASAGKTEIDLYSIIKEGRLVQRAGQ